MYYNKIRNRRFKIIAVICVVLILSCIFFVIDYLKTDKGSPPIFCIRIKEKEDGSQEYVGMFYKVYKYVYSEENATKYKIGPIWMKFDKPEYQEQESGFSKKDLIDIYNEPNI